MTTLTALSCLSDGTSGALSSLSRPPDPCTDRRWRHYCLDLDVYTWYSSPIRRYHDIVVHRLLARVLSATGADAGAGADADVGALTLMAADLTTQSRWKNAAITRSAEVGRAVIIQQERARGREAFDGSITGINDERKSLTVTVKDFGINKTLTISYRDLLHHYDPETDTITFNPGRPSAFTASTLQGHVPIALKVSGAPVQITGSLHGVEPLVNPQPTPLPADLTADNTPYEARVLAIHRRAPGVALAYFGPKADKNIRYDVPGLLPLTSVPDAVPGATYDVGVVAVERPENGWTRVVLARVGAGADAGDAHCADGLWADPADDVVSAVGEGPINSSVVLAGWPFAVGMAGFTPLRAGDRVRSIVSQLKASNMGLWARLTRCPIPLPVVAPGEWRARLLDAAVTGEMKRGVYYVIFGETHAHHYDASGVVPWPVSLPLPSVDDRIKVRGLEAPPPEGERDRPIRLRLTLATDPPRVRLPGEPTPGDIVQARVTEVVTGRGAVLQLTAGPEALPGLLRDVRRPVMVGELVMVVVEDVDDFGCHVRLAAPLGEAPQVGAEYDAVVNNVAPNGNVFVNYGPALVCFDRSGIIKRQVLGNMRLTANDRLRVRVTLVPAEEGKYVELEVVPPPTQGVAEAKVEPAIDPEAKQPAPRPHPFEDILNNGEYDGRVLSVSEDNSLGVFGGQASHPKLWLAGA
jgi:hypothetical protein